MEICLVILLTFLYGDLSSNFVNIFFVWPVLVFDVPNRLVVAYSRHLNLINTFSIRRFDRLNGPSVSSFDLHNDDREEAVTT